MAKSFSYEAKTYSYITKTYIYKTFRLYGCFG
mgnify:CR=1 FL=1